MKISATKTGYRIYFRHPVTGKRFRRTYKGLNRSQAMQLLRELYSKAGETRGGFVGTRRRGLRDAIDGYLTARSSNKSPSSQSLDRLCFFEYLDICGTSATTNCISHESVDLYIESRRKAGNSAATINRRLNSLKSFFKWLERDAFLDRGFSSDVKRVKENSRQAKRLSDQEIVRVQMEAGPVLRLQIQIAATLGLRPIEIVNLRWSWLDFRSLTLSIGTDGKFQTKSGKPKTLPLPPGLAHALQSWSRRCEWVFPSNDLDGPQRRDVLTTAWVRASKKAGVKDANFYDLRATAATRLAEQGHGDSTIAKVLGHSTAAMARRYSNKVDGDVIKGGVAQLEQSYGDLFVPNLSEFVGSDFVAEAN